MSHPLDTMEAWSDQQSIELFARVDGLRYFLLFNEQLMSADASSQQYSYFVYHDDNRVWIQQSWRIVVAACCIENTANEPDLYARLYEQWWYAFVEKISELVKRECSALNKAQHHCCDIQACGDCADENEEQIIFAQNIRKESWLCND